MCRAVQYVLWTFSGLLLGRMGCSLDLRAAVFKRRQVGPDAMTFPKNWPKNWPENCPPNDAIDAAGDVFRLVRNDPPNPDDLESHFEAGTLKSAPHCLRCGLSVFREIRDAVHQRVLIPKLGRLIARGTLKAEHGKTKLTSGKQPTHTTWWAFSEVNRETLFAVVPEDA